MNTELVDLGLSVKWAKCNLGAEHEWDYSKYYAQGDVNGYDEDTILHSSMTNDDILHGIKSRFDRFTKKWYTPHKSSKYNEDILDNDYDAAYIATSGIMRMPTKAEQEELVNSKFIVKEVIKIDGIEGSKFTSIKDGYVGNYIFVPFASCSYYGSVYYVDNISWCWRSSIDTDEDYNKVGAWVFGCNQKKL